MLDQIGRLNFSTFLSSLMVIIVAVRILLFYRPVLVLAVKTTGLCVDDRTFRGSKLFVAEERKPCFSGLPW